jgi:hypothetical protein
LGITKQPGGPHVLLIVLFIGMSFPPVLAQSSKELHKYGLLITAVQVAGEKMYGIYGETLPAGLNRGVFLELMKRELPQKYYKALVDHRYVNIIPRGTYYRLVVFQGRSLILYDFSCTDRVDGPVLTSAERVSLADLEKLDPCSNLSD